MSTFCSKQFQEICATVWRDRKNVIAGRGFLTGEAALMRAVYWRLSKKGLVKNHSPEHYSSMESILSYETVVLCVLELNGTPRFDGETFLKELRELYRKEFSQENEN